MSINNTRHATSPGAFVFQKSVQIQKKMISTILKSVAVKPTQNLTSAKSISTGTGKGFLVNTKA